MIWKPSRSSRSGSHRVSPNPLAHTVHVRQHRRLSIDSSKRLDLIGFWNLVRSIFLFCSFVLSRASLYLHASLAVLSFLYVLLQLPQILLEAPSILFMTARILRHCDSQKASNRVVTGGVLVIACI